MDEKLKKDLDTLQEILQATLDEGLLYLNNIAELPTSVSNQIPAMAHLENAGKGGMATLEAFKSRFKQLMVASAGPRYWGFVTGGTTPAAMMGDMLTTYYDQNTQTNKGHGDLSAAIEFETVQLLLEFFGLPNDFLGGFVTRATMSNFTCLGVARQWIGKQQGLDIAKNGISGDIKILSATPHSSSIKALSMLGLGGSNITLIQTLEGTREAMDIGELEQTLSDLDGQPVILISSGGTVNTVDYDDFQGISKLKDKFNFWWHIDAAFGGFAAVSPKYAHLVAGWEKADSITMDGHKWLNVPYESAFFFVKEKHKYLQVETFQNSNAPYIGDPLDNFNYLNFLPENSRRLKALPAWFTLNAYGKEGYREIIERNIRLAQQLGAYIQESETFELLALVRLNTVCFTLKNEPNPAKVQAFLDTLNERSKVFMTPTFFNQRKGIRAALVNWRTTESDVQMVQKEMNEAFEHISTMSF